MLWILAGVGVAFAVAADEPPKPDLGEQIRSWGGAILGLVGAVLGLLGFLKSRKTAASTLRLEVAQHLSEAWDLMGGKPGTTIIR